MARPEVTGKKLPSPAPFQLGAYTIETFCAAHGLSPAMYFKLRKAGLGPDEMEMGRRKGISINPRPNGVASVRPRPNDPSLARLRLQARTVAKTACPNLPNNLRAFPPWRRGVGVVAFELGRRPKCSSNKRMISMQDQPINLQASTVNDGAPLQPIAAPITAADLEDLARHCKTSDAALDAFIRAVDPSSVFAALDRITAPGKSH